MAISDLIALRQVLIEEAKQKYLKPLPRKQTVQQLEFNRAEPIQKATMALPSRAFGGKGLSRSIPEDATAEQVQNLLKDVGAVPPRRLLNNLSGKGMARMPGMDELSDAANAGRLDMAESTRAKGLGSLPTNRMYSADQGLKKSAAKDRAAGLRMDSPKVDIKNSYEFSDLGPSENMTESLREAQGLVQKAEKFSRVQNHIVELGRNQAEKVPMVYGSGPKMTRILQYLESQTRGLTDMKKKTEVMREFLSSPEMGGVSMEMMEHYAPELTKAWMGRVKNNLAQNFTEIAQGKVSEPLVASLTNKAKDLMLKAPAAAQQYLEAALNAKLGRDHTQRLELAQAMSKKEAVDRMELPSVSSMMDEVDHVSPIPGQRITQTRKEYLDRAAMADPKNLDDAAGTGSTPKAIEEAAARKDAWNVENSVGRASQKSAEWLLPQQKYVGTANTVKPARTKILHQKAEALRSEIEGELGRKLNGNDYIGLPSDDVTPAIQKKIHMLLDSANDIKAQNAKLGTHYSDVPVARTVDDAGKAAGTWPPMAPEAGNLLKIRQAIEGQVPPKSWDPIAKKAVAGGTEALSGMDIAIHAVASAGSKKAPLTKNLLEEIGQFAKLSEPEWPQFLKIIRTLGMKIPKGML